MSSSLEGRATIGRAHQCPGECHSQEAITTIPAWWEVEEAKYKDVFLSTFEAVFGKLRGSWGDGLKRVSF